ncbi:MAG: PRC-barrel domain-containing protein [Methylocella sp.]
MLTNVTFLKGLVIQATDGELGTVDQFYFDDETWAIRYLTVETGGWLGGRQVLIWQRFSGRGNSPIDPQSAWFFLGPGAFCRAKFVF